MYYCSSPYTCKNSLSKKNITLLLLKVSSIAWHQHYNELFSPVKWTSFERGTFRLTNSLEVQHVLKLMGCGGSEGWPTCDGFPRLGGARRRSGTGAALGTLRDAGEGLPRTIRALLCRKTHKKQLSTKESSTNDVLNFLLHSLHTNSR